MVHTMLAALGPIVLGFLVGWLSGRYHFVKREYAQAFADFVVKIALPLALFLAAATSSPSAILNVDYALSLAVGLIGSYIVAYIAGKLIFKHTHTDATMQALSASFPDMAYCGPPVLLAAVGSAGLIAMVIGNLIYTVIIIPLALLALGGRQKGASPLKSLWHAVSQPLVFLPILGAILAVAGIKLPELLQNSVNELGKTAGGVALFFLGLFLSGEKLKIRPELVFNVLVKNVLQAALILGMGLALGLKGDLLISAFLIGVLPTATAVPALAVTNQAYMDDAASTVLLSTLFSLVSITVGIAVAAQF
ncbi:AEC family transporter [Bordetella avium]|uniref:Transporter n=1 Tax=Bordetella avium (strain 197N) TaxID=360910 RepID=Q2KX17_BORA1|nr:AEC family transporter [Bordetella avium]AZY48266.1 AEC family transporter [Bordetella avium]AZY51651.1 AEC family transporter [Bordetella avium]RIQ13489.1 AEC family transporter [Bordetella avium]RIQ16557.1 AEC family transporter [Bordetella avium]RIQ31316.1 AEC family transporter [Bordetella avium]